MFFYSGYQVEMHIELFKSENNMKSGIYSLKRKREHWLVWLSELSAGL